MPRFLRSFRPATCALLLLSLLTMGAGACGQRPVVAIGLPSAASPSLPIRITLQAGVDPTQSTVTLDGVDVTAQFAPAPPGLVGSIPVPAPGEHRLGVTSQRSMLGLSIPITNGRLFDVPAPAPDVASVEPAPGATGVPRSAWLRFQLASAAPADALAGFGFALECDGKRVQRSAHALGDGALVLNPSPELPAGASCRAVWRASDGGVAESAFAVAPDAPGAPARAHYDRLDPLAFAPFPDDYWTVPDASQPSGLAIDMPVPEISEPFQQQAFQALIGQTVGVDGWSRMPPIVVAFSHPLDPSSVPSDEHASLDPLAPVSLVDVDPSSPAYGQRVPYRMSLRSDEAPDGSYDHVALLFPTIDLREHGRYAVAITRRAFAAGEPGRPVGPSPMFAEVLSAPDGAEAPEVVRARDRIEASLATLAALPDVPIPVEDVALVFGLSIRTQPSPADLVSIKERTLAAAPPQLLLPDLSNPCPNPNNFCIRTVGTRALEIRGRVQLPNYRDPDLRVFARDEITGEPLQTGVSNVPFMMTLPIEALDGPVPIVMYQHGNPGSPLEATRDGGTGYLDDAGFAVAGIQDTLNREIGQDIALQVSVILFFSVQVQQLPDYWVQTGADMIGFLRAIEGMGALDLMRRGANGEPELGPDGIPEIDTSRILYHGISEGGNNAQRFLPFAPELIAATPTVGGARLGETLIHQSSDDILAQVGALMPDLRPVELWVGLSLFQLGFDPQDGHSYLKHLYREPLLPFAGSSDVTPPSTLWTEGIGDTLVPNNATRAAAIEIGIPQVRPIVRAIPGVAQVDPPVSQNLGAGLTSGHFQYDPATTPYCVTRPQPEGHYCPQSAPEAQAQRRHFLESALEGAAEIVSPF
ncbi:MAG: hypothetical protein DCC71_14595 [Proteobacteria bacterium]|nr:MAG: hypothetical protein DCC71_14595 [Pseudomonadota bacterium]